VSAFPIIETPESSRWGNRAAPGEAASSTAPPNYQSSGRRTRKRAAYGHRFWLGRGGGADFVFFFGPRRGVCRKPTLCRRCGGGDAAPTKSPSSPALPYGGAVEYAPHPWPMDQRPWRFAMCHAAQLGYCVAAGGAESLGHRSRERQLDVRVPPHLIPKNHPLAAGAWVNTGDPGGRRTIGR